MKTSQPVVLRLPAEACPTLIGALWAVAAVAAAENQSELLRLAALVHVAHCRTLQVDPRAVGELLIGLPPRLRGAYSEQLGRQAKLPTPP